MNKNPKMFCWFDKIEKEFLVDSAVFSRRERDVCRGYLKAFENDKRMNPHEYDLYCMCEIDAETGEVIPSIPPRKVDPMQVYEHVEDTKGDVVDE